MDIYHPRELSDDGIFAQTGNKYKNISVLKKKKKIMGI